MKTKKSRLKIQKYLDGWYVIGFCEKDLRIGPYERCQDAARDFDHLVAADTADRKLHALQQG